MDQIKKAVISFVEGGDNNDVKLLEMVLHANFQNIQEGSYNQSEVQIFSKTQYIELVRNKTFGGKPRQINFKSIEQLGNIAIVKVELVSKVLEFFSTIICIATNGNWEIITNIPKIQIINRDLL